MLFRSAEMFEIIFNTRTYDIGAIYNWGNLDGSLFVNSVNARTNTFVSQYQIYESRIDTEIAKTLENMKR